MNYFKSVSTKLVTEKTHRTVKPIKNIEAATDLIRKEIGDRDKEYFVILNLDTKCRPLNYSIVHIGAINSCMIHPSSILKTAILSNAYGAILLHNHPAGSLTPSEHDIESGARLAAAMQIIGIDLLDCIIVNKEQSKSFINEVSSRATDLYTIQGLFEENIESPTLNRLQKLSEEDYKSYIELIVQKETGITDKNDLDDIYERYMNSDETTILSDKMLELIDEQRILINHRKLQERDLLSSTTSKTVKEGKPKKKSKARTI